MSDIRYPDPKLGIAGQDEVITLAMCLFGEARDQIDAAMQGVAATIVNRASHPCWWGRDIKGVVLKPWQFSSFNSDDPNRPKLLEPLKHEKLEVWVRCFRFAEKAVERLLEDNTFGATHYFDISILPPKWARDATLTVQYGRIKFYKDVR